MADKSVHVPPQGDSARMKFYPSAWVSVQVAHSIRQRGRPRFPPSRPPVRIGLRRRQEETMPTFRPAASLGAIALTVTALAGLSLAGPVLGGAGIARPALAGAAVPDRGVLPPKNPAHNVSPDPNFLAARSCAGGGDSAACNAI